MVLNNSMVVDTKESDQPAKTGRSELSVPAYVRSFLFSLGVYMYIILPDWFRVSVSGLLD